MLYSFLIMRRYKIFILFLALVLAGLFVFRKELISQEPHYGKNPPSPLSIPAYRLAVHPLHNPGELIHIYQPLIDYLNIHLNGATLTLEASRDYPHFEIKYKTRFPDFILPNPWQTLQAEKYGYHVIAMAGEPEDFKGIFLVRKESSIKEPGDLKGKSVSYPASTALAACIMPQYFLYQHGIDIHKDIKNLYVGSQESAILNVYFGSTAVGVTWPQPWRTFQIEQPEKAAALKVIWETESLVNNSVMVRDDVPDEVRNQVRTLIIGLNKTDEGRLILAGIQTARFIPATDADYNRVQTFITHFEREVRPVEEK